MGARVGLVVGILFVLAAGPQPASAQTLVRPRIGAAWGVVARPGTLEIASGPRTPLVYHGGAVMRGVHVHTLFWAPPGYRFDGSPGLGALGYEDLLKRFFTDVAHDSGASTNVFSTLRQYSDGRGQGSYAISYAPAVDAIELTDPYPPARRQCASPGGLATCLTDLQVRRELRHVIASRDPSGSGLHDLWFVFLPPDVDECVTPTSCATNDFLGYHSISQLAPGPVIYAVLPDPLVQGPAVPGADPQGNPEAESAIDTTAHEAAESITNPTGTGWMDPNGNEVGDKCETPEDGTPLGFALNGSPFNELIAGDEFLIQTMWSNTAMGCVQRSGVTSAPPPLPRVALRQFSPSVSGSIGVRRRGVTVAVALIRSGARVALARGRTRADGSWGPLTLRSSTGHEHGVGDDREAITVRYGARGPRSDVIATGSGGDPFSESGWTGWYDLDSGFAIGSHSVALSPCGQTGVLTLRVGGTPTAAPIDQCDSETDVSLVRTRRLSAASRIELSSEDNRATTDRNGSGALVTLTVGLGEPGSFASLGNDLVLFFPSGLPACTAELRTQTALCSGLVPTAAYTLTRTRGGRVLHARAGIGGAATFPSPRGGIRGGDLLTLRNGAGRRLTSLHVAHLRVAISGQQTVVRSGRCEPGDYWGAPLSSPPQSSATGLGITGDGTVCPPSGSAAGLPVKRISQIDDRSGGQTRTDVPAIARTTPLDGETLYGPFIALARAGLPGLHGSTITPSARIGLTITRAGSGRVAFSAHNVDTSRGVAVARLSSGAYSATWVLSDSNGDTRTVRTGFVEQR